MTSRIRPQDGALSLQFGLGVNSTASDSFVDERECVLGQNCVLKPFNTDMITRPPFDLVGTVPNGQEIRGFIFLHHPILDSPQMLVQAGSNIYLWDGTDSSSVPFSLVGTCNANARLRGRIWSHQWGLGTDPIVLISDLELLEPVRAWDGTQMLTPVFNNVDSTAFGSFYARYIVVRDERAYYGAIRDSSGYFEHLLVGSSIEDYETINTNIAAASFADPFFLITPDLRDINGMSEAFGVLGISTEKGSVWKLMGSDATDFEFKSLYAGSAAVGDEGFTFVGNDIAYGRQGRIESLVATDSFGDVGTDDLTRPIGHDVQNIESWTIVYNSRLQHIYCLPSSGVSMWVFFKDVFDQGGSPWMEWTTNHDLSFQPTCIMNGYHPVDGLEYVFMGDSSGNIYKLEGTYNNGGDGGTAPIVAKRLSRLYTGGADAMSFNWDGWVRGKSQSEAEVTVTLEYVDEAGFTRDSRVFTLADPAGTLFYYGGSGDEAAYYGGDPAEGEAAYYNVSGRGPFQRTKMAWAGSCYDLQIRVEVEGDDKTTIGEVGLRPRAAK